MTDEVLLEQVEIRLVPRQDQLKAQPLEEAGDRAAEPVAKQGGRRGMKLQLQRLVHGGEIAGLAAQMGAPADLAVDRLAKLTGGAPLRLPLAQGQASSGLAVTLPAGKKVLQGRQNLIRHRKSPQLLAKSAIAPSNRVTDKVASAPLQLGVIPAGKAASTLWPCNGPLPPNHDEHIR